jgi:acyl carrier protein
MDEVMMRINKVFRAVFADEKLTVDENTTPDDIEGWDSLQHINLISMLESEFGIRFDVDQIVSIEGVGDMATIIRTML